MVTFFLHLFINTATVTVINKMTAIVSVTPPKEPSIAVCTFDPDCSIVGNTCVVSFVLCYNGISIS